MSKIFVCVGSRPYQFNRLFDALDKLVENGEITSPIFAQIGASIYEPKHFPYEHFLDPDVFNAKMQEADIVISHGASGSIMRALNDGKKVIAVSRLEKYGEHINDHQVGINETLAYEGLVLYVEDFTELGQAIRKIETGEVQLKPWRNDNPMSIVEVIDQFIERELLLK